MKKLLFKKIQQQESPIENNIGERFQVALLIEGGEYRPMNWKIPEGYSIKLLPGYYSGPDDPRLKDEEEV